MQKVLHPVDQEISFKCLWQILHISVQVNFLQNTRFLNDSNQRPKYKIILFLENII